MLELHKPLRIKDIMGQGVRLPSDNIADLLTDDDLHAIASECWTQYAADLDTLDEERTLLAEIEREIKPYLGEYRSNSTRANCAKLPVIAKACYGFSARAYPLIFEAEQLVEYKTKGRPIKRQAMQQGQGEEAQQQPADGDTDLKRAAADRMGTYTTWQLRDKLPEWEDDVHALLARYAATGMMFKKIFWNEAEARVDYQLISRSNLIINRCATDMAKDPFSFVENIYGYEAQEMMMGGEWLDVAEDMALEYDKCYGKMEQSTRLDLDGDGYPEPYIVTMLAQSEFGEGGDCGGVGTVVRIERNWEGMPEFNGSKVARIKARCDYIPYRFWPSLDGSFYGWGFPHLILSAARSANTSLNSLLDAGELANTAMGFIKPDARIKRGETKVERGTFSELHTIDGNLAAAVYQLQFQPPSQALFDLMQFCLTYAEEASGMRDVLQGEAIGANIPATTIMAQTDEALKPFKAILRGFKASLSKEFRAFFRFNCEHPDDAAYRNLLDDPQASMAQDFDLDSWDSYPTLNVQDVTAMQSMAKSQDVLGMAANGMVAPKPAARFHLRTIRVPEDQITELLEFEPTSQDKQLQLAVAQKDAMDAQNKQMELQYKMEQLRQANRKVDVDEAKANADIGKTLAETQEIAERVALDDRAQQIDYIKSTAEMEARENEREEQGK